jgi:hypothetical protein
MFIDGDAFPVVDPMPLIVDGLAKAPLIAVRRAENLNEPQPHPCFCVTTVGTWRSLHGDWSRGPTWPEVNGAPVSDVGAHLLRALELAGTPWIQLLRSNGTKLHPLFFAIYGDTIYHHGAGFRKRGLLTREDREAAPKGLSAPRVPGIGLAMRGINRRRGRAWKLRTEEHNRQQSQAMFDRIAQGGSDWLSELDWVRARETVSRA